MVFVRYFIFCFLLLSTGLVSYGLAAEESVIDDHRFFSADVALGYRAINVEDYARRAVQYSPLESGSTASADIKALSDVQRFSFDGSFLTDSDYSAEADYDYSGLFRFSFASESLVHNLDHFSYQRPTAQVGGLDRVFFSDNDPGDNYSVEVGQDRVSLKGKLPDYPAHLTLGYWRLERSGHKQLRYVDESCTGCHMQSRSQKLDRVTEEVSLGLDAHIGHVNVALEQVVREFRVRNSTPADPFGLMFPAAGSPGRPAGVYPHDEIPDSRYTATTLKASTSPSGGLVAAASFSVGKKENRSDLADVSGNVIADVEAETDFRKGAADLSLTPSPFWTFNFRYRFLDTDTSNTPQMTNLSSSSDIAVRPSIDLTKATYGASASFRPSRCLTLKGEFERNELQRSNTWDGDLANFDLLWKLPEEENVNRFRLDFISRPLVTSALKINGWYQYLHSDDPSYGTSLEDKQEVYAGVSWNPSELFGATGNVRLSRGTSSDYLRPAVVSGTLFNNRYDRTEKREAFTSGLWLQPIPQLNFNLHYGFLLSDVRQDLAYGSGSDSIFDDNVDWTQRSHTATLTANWQILKSLKGLFEGRYIRSKSSYDPDFPTQTVLGFDVDASLLEEISELDIVQTGLALGLEWQIDEFWRCSARFSHDDYEDRNSSAFDGSVEYYMLNIARAW